MIINKVDRKFLKKIHKAFVLFHFPITPFDFSVSSIHHFLFFFLISLAALEITNAVNPTAAPTPAAAFIVFLFDFSSVPYGVGCW